FIKAQDPIGTQKVGMLLAKIPEVQEVHDIAGDDGYLIKVRTNDAKGLVELMRNSLGKIGEIISTRTTIVLETVKEEQKLVIPTIEDKSYDKKKSKYTCIRQHYFCLSRRLYCMGFYLFLYRKGFAKL